MKRARANESGAPGPTLDGRLRRAERSREAIVQALFDLVSEGDLQPSAYRVAERAGVGIRTVFRHFTEMDTLYAALSERLLAIVQPLRVEPPPPGNVATRAAALVRKRAALFERISPYRRSGDLHRWGSRFLQNQHRQSVKIFRGELLEWLPELSSAPPSLVDALDVALSFETWDRLRTDQALGRKRAFEVVERMVAALVATLGARTRSRRRG